ncbi:MAG: hypothetical protein K0S96_998 [Geminicoccaceae bacterium]|nr:hypothetical protein [Geminicoccaceae bacterium]
MSDPRLPTERASVDLEVDLKIDEQVHRFLDIKNKLSFFIITAAAGSVAFTLNFSVSSLKLLEVSAHRLIFGAILVVAAILALLAIAAILASLSREIASYQLHLKNRYARKIWGNLSPSEQAEWTRINRTAKWFQNASFVALCASVTTQVALFGFFLTTEDIQMHHYGEDSTAVQSTIDGFRVIFTNKISGEEIVMAIPRNGVLSDPGQEVQQEKVEHVAREIAHVLRRELD